MANDFIQTLNGHKTTQPPVWLMRQAGRYLPEYRALRAEAGDFMTAVFTPPMATEITLQPIKRFNHLDAAILFSDILVIPHVLGLNVTFTKGEGPLVTGLPDMGPNSALEDFDYKPERLDPIIEAVRMIRAQLDPSKTLIGFAGSPWTVACYMISGRNHDEFRDAKTWALAHPDRLDALLDVLVEVTSTYLFDQIEAGAQVVQLFDSWAGSLAGHQELFDRFIIGPNARIVEKVRSKYSNIPIIGFPRQCGVWLPRFAAHTAVDAVGLDWSVDLVWADSVLPAGFPVQGNLDPITLLVGGDALTREAEHIIHTLANRPFVFNLGHGVLPPTPPEHVAQLLDIVKK